jgi:hypothetical protein
LKQTYEKKEIKKTNVKKRKKIKEIVNQREDREGENEKE